MRLICPNCDAQYEVDDSVIPVDGRDVQCSNCGTTWFQPGPGMEAEEKALMPPAPEPTPEPEAEVAIEPEPEPTQDTPTETEAPQRRPMDESVLNVLREEAERESTARRAEGRAPLESQPDLGLDEGTAAAAQGLRERVARLRAASDEAVDPPTVEPTSTGSRRDLLPDIEEINSTLRATSDRRESGASSQVLENDPLPRRRGQFGLGFGAVVVLGALAAALYLLAPKIAMMAPGTKPFLVGYVDSVNAVRVSVNSTVTGAAEKATGFLTDLAK
ncbi:hypothetical protein ATO10_13269 [Actibacterium atlanticum]|uniref:Zinc finger/thioredoxin putative domain-containing protein n=1 Tax=Actibacterium atlanticum TaxID=1461693 RepID=A0A058ZHT5_9RHOB|nr:zinc-ribbon domain-containing protein [Actibacterium atlanticum]KCV81153.1 hypothetical protein ATO10_13269 [Actibacterium atlanticum]